MSDLNPLRGTKAHIDQVALTNHPIDRTFASYFCDHFNMMVNPEWMRRIDEWWRKQDDLPSRAEAIRRLVELGLKVKKP